MAPTPEQRESLRNRIIQIDGWLAPAGVDAIRKSVSLPLCMLWLKSEIDEELNTRKNGYLFALAKYPVFAVEKACNDFALRAENGRGNRSDAEFLPKVSEMCVEARKAMRPLLDQRADIARILDATIRTEPTTKTDEEKARVRASLARFRSSVTAAATDDQARSKVATEEAKATPADAYVQGPFDQADAQKLRGWQPVGDFATRRQDKASASSTA